VSLRHVELCGAHADFNDESRFEQIIGQFKAGGIQICSIGVESFQDAASFEKRLRFLKLAGATRMSITFSPQDHLQTIQTIDRLAERYGVFCGIHNHGGYDWLGSRKILSYIFSHAGRHVGLEMDSAWAMQAGEDPIAMAEQFADRLYGVHFKDFVFDRAGKGVDVVLGEGNLRLQPLVELIKTKAPEGCVSVIEYEADVDNPAPAIARSIGAIRAIA
jgi:sugar phosphate isomerase/epimerase